MNQVENDHWNLIKIYSAIEETKITVKNLYNFEVSDIDSIELSNTKLTFYIVIMESAVPPVQVVIDSESDHVQINLDFPKEFLNSLKY